MKLIYRSFFVTMFALLISATAFAHDIEAVNADGVTIYYKWINNQTELAVSYRGDNFTSFMNEYSGNVIIPEIVDYNGKTYNVTSIYEYAFSYCTELISVVVPNSVRGIWVRAFQGCSGLTSITIPNSVTSIGQDAFSGCTSLSNPVKNDYYFFYMPTSYIGAYEIPFGITTISPRAFCNCKLLSAVTIPSTVTKIWETAFENCNGLTTISVEENNSVYDSRNNCNAIIQTASNKIIAGCKYTIIPNNVVSIGESAFYNWSGLTSLEIPNSVTTIEDAAFYGCSGLTSLDIPNSVTFIGNSAFYGCSGLTTLEIPNSVTSIESRTFNNCSGLTSLEIPNSVTFIGNSAFYGCI